MNGEAAVARRQDEPGPTAGCAEALAGPSLGQRMRDVGSALRQVFGMPDYERYLHHAAVAHPGAPVLTRREHYAQMIERRYGKGPGRCC